MPLTLDPMTEVDYGHWLEIAVPNYAAEKVANGTWAPDEALKLAHAAFASVLTQGRETLGQYLYTLLAQPQQLKVGYLWFGRQGMAAYLYDLFILPDFRRQGYGRQAMGCLEASAVALGFRDIKLHVFAQNQAALALYQSLGYAITDLNLRKTLAATP